MAKPVTITAQKAVNSNRFVSSEDFTVYILAERVIMVTSFLF